MLNPVLSVTVVAPDPTLLTTAELQNITGRTATGDATDLTRLEARAADAITQACNVTADGAKPPTLRQETCVDTFRLNRWSGRQQHRGYLETLPLSRRPIVSVTSVVEAGVTLDPTMDFEIRAAAGTLVRLFNGETSRWAADLIVVTYVAGWATVPQGLKRAAEKLVRLYSETEGRDTSVRSEEITGVMSRTYISGAPDDPAIPREVMDDLAPYINPLV